MFRCTECDFLSETKEDHPCHKPNTLCKFAKVELIHLLHEKGQYANLGSLQRFIAGPEGNDKMITVPLQICCDTGDPRLYTPYRPGVTCIKCLENVPFTEPTE